MLKTLATHIAIREERGATAVAYGIMVAAIAVVIIVIVITLREQVQATFQVLSDQISDIGGA